MCVHQCNTDLSENFADAAKKASTTTVMAIVITATRKMITNTPAFDKKRRKKKQNTKWQQQQKLRESKQKCETKYISRRIYMYRRTFKKVEEKRQNNTKNNLKLSWGCYFSVKCDCNDSLVLLCPFFFRLIL